MNHPALPNPATEHSAAGEPPLRYDGVLSIRAPGNSVQADQNEFINAPRRGVVWFESAGTGKSTALLARFDALHRDFGVPDDRLCVVTRFAASRDALVDRATQETSRRIHTFHSLAWELVRDTLPRDTTIFEWLGRQPATVADNISNRRGVISVSSNLSNAQRRLVDECYDQCVRDNPDFRATMERARIDSFTTPARAADDPEVHEALTRIDLVASADRAFTERVESDWTGTGLWPIPGIVLRGTDGVPDTLDVEGSPLLTSGYLRELDLYIVLGARNAIRDERLDRSRATSPTLSKLTWNKTRLLLGRSTANVRCVSTVADLKNLAAQVSYLLSQAQMSDVRFLTSHSRHGGWIPVSEALFRIGEHAELRGTDPRSLDATDDAHNDATPGARLARAAAHYYRVFYSLLESRRIETFNRIFARFSSRDTDPERVPLERLHCMQHLLIDDVQTLLPIDLNFVTAIHQRLVTEGSPVDRPSISGVGDRFQCLSENERFDGVSLETWLDQSGIDTIDGIQTSNLRSTPSIAHCADVLAQSANPDALRDPDARVVHVTSAEDSRPVTVIHRFGPADAVDVVRQLLDSIGEHERLLVVALSEEDPAYGAILGAYAFSRDKRLRILPVSETLGIDAESVLLIGDAPAPFYNQPPLTPKIAPKKLAYIGLTRARKLCVWLCHRFTHGSSNALENEAPQSLKTELSGLPGVLNPSR